MDFCLCVRFWRLHPSSSCFEKMDDREKVQTKNHSLAVETDFPMAQLYLPLLATARRERKWLVR